jgi:hypothetical protein
MDNQAENECTLQDLIAQGACYPLAMRVWQQLMPRRPTLTKAKLSNPMIRSSCAFEDTDSEDDLEKAALN